jgi:hypothetical protein
VIGTWGRHCPSVYMDKSAGPYLFKQEQSACRTLHKSFAFQLTMAKKASTLTNNELKN